MIKYAAFGLLAALLLACGGYSERRLSKGPHEREVRAALEWAMDKQRAECLAALNQRDQELQDVIKAALRP